MIVLTAGLESLIKASVHPSIHPYIYIYILTLSQVKDVSIVGNGWRHQPAQERKEEEDGGY